MEKMNKISQAKKAGFVTRNMARQAKPAGYHVQAREILIFAHLNQVLISPAGYDYYIRAYLESGRCPCDKDRLQCPCPESLLEIKEQGHCKCQLFFRDYQTYGKVKGIISGE